MRITLVLFLVFSMLSIVLWFSTLSPNVVTEANMDQIVLLRMDEALCSGFVIKEGFIATAKHCIMHESHLNQVTYNDGTVVPFTVVASGPDLNSDWAVVEADTGDVEPLSIRDTRINTGERINHVGYRGPSTQQIKFGFVTAVTDHKIYMIGDAFHGNSGSPVFDEQGRVIGIISTSYQPVPIMSCCPILLLIKELNK